MTTSYSSAPAVLHAASDAHGLSKLKEGFGWTPEDDQLFALGYPVMRWLVDGHPDDENVEAVVEAATKKAHPSYGVAWPRKVTMRLLRMWATRNNKPANTTTDDIAPAEVSAIVTKFVFWGAGTAFDKNEDGILLLEAAVGPTAVAEAVASALEGMSEQEWTIPAHDSVATLVAVGAVLLRVAPNTREGIRKRLAALLEARRSVAGEAFLNKGLDLILNGAEAVRRSGPRVGGEVNARFAILADDEPEYLREIVAKDAAYDGRYEARLAFLSDPNAALESYANSWKKIKGADGQRNFAATIGRIRSASAVRLLLEMSSASKAKKDVQAWFAAHAAEVQPFLEGLSGQEKDWADALKKTKKK